MTNRIRKQLEVLLNNDAMRQVQKDIQEIVSVAGGVSKLPASQLRAVAAEALFGVPQVTTAFERALAEACIPREPEPSEPVEEVAPVEVAAPVVAAVAGTLAQRIWNAVSTLCGKGVQVLKRGWNFLRRAPAVRVVSGVASVAWVGAKFGALVALGVTVLLSQGAYQRMRKHAVHAWKVTRPQIQEMVGRVKRAVRIAWAATQVAYYWAKEKAKKVVAFITRNVDRGAQFCGRIAAYGLVLVMWVLLQFYVMYVTARKTLQEELAHHPALAPTWQVAQANA